MDMATQGITILTWSTIITFTRRFVKERRQLRERSIYEEATKVYPNFPHISRRGKYFKEFYQRKKLVNNLLDFFGKYHVTSSVKPTFFQNVYRTYWCTYVV